MIQNLSVKHPELPVVGYKPLGDKEYRARGITTYCESKRVRLRHDAPWLQDFMEEVCAFPYGSHDDIVDVLSEGVNYLSASGALMPGQAQKEEKTKREKLFGPPKQKRAAIRQQVDYYGR